MKPQKIARQTPLRDLVLKVHHLELTECNTFEDSKEVIRLMVKNIEEVLQALACFAPPNRRIERAADLLKLKATRLLKFCSEMPEAENGSQEWRRITRDIIVNYEQFRIEAGMLYQLVVPGATFSVFVPLCEDAWLETEGNSQTSSKPGCRANQGSRSPSA